MGSVVILLVFVWGYVINLGYLVFNVFGILKCFLCFFGVEEGVYLCDNG